MKLIIDKENVTISMKIESMDEVADAAVLVSLGSSMNHPFVSQFCAGLGELLKLIEPEDFA